MIAIFGCRLRCDDVHINQPVVINYVVFAMSFDGINRLDDINVNDRVRIYRES